ncbi:winged helix-turn-helix domain-containing protein [Dietzia cercidiphylli]|uniref:winged helix-turn-helix domain-containing protein n=1 Tax=Dietzia cercidiphylli TaxID=498199 RepID=UPI00223B0A05|nr:transcriptional regulator [Dietzia cercidiphylli]MCT1515665.1 transcriptional regulator [Dietzia cercidiphylli]
MTGPQRAAPADPVTPDADAPDADAPAPDARPDGHARHRLDEVIHAPVRFSIVAALAGVDDAEFATIRDAVEVSDSTLSKQVAVLEKAGYVKVRKGYVGKRPRTWLELSRDGRRAYGSHLEALRAIAGG